jgi:chromosomal replication initiator protein
VPLALELTPAWQDLKNKLRSEVGDSVYAVWFSCLSVCSWDGAILVVASKPGTERFLSERFGRTVERCAQAALGDHVRVAFEGEAAADAHKALRDAGRHHADPVLRDQPFVPRYTFDQFIIGDGNRLAHAAALAVAEAPGAAYNPLFLHSSPGLGKTHLLHAIGNYLAAYEPATTVRYTTVEAFTNDFLAALHGRALDQFKELYRTVDVLLIDDIQFLENKLKTEEEFFHTFNALYDSGRQLVLTCDRLPVQLVDLEQRLRERLEAGLVAHLAAPDQATRVAILRKRAEIDAIEVQEPEVFELIAERVTDNVRLLEGALIRIVAHHSLTGRPLDLGLARDVLDELYPPVGVHIGAQHTSPKQIIGAVAQSFSLSADDIVSSSRRAKVSWARQVAIHLCRELTDLSLDQIGRNFGGRNHATVLHACKRVQERIIVNSDDAQTVDVLVRQLAGHQADGDS